MFKCILTPTPSPLFRKKKMQYAGPAWDELKHIRQAIGFLVSIYPSAIFAVLVQMDRVKY